MKKVFFLLLFFYLTAFFPVFSQTPGFRFASMGDAQHEVTRFTNTAAQINSLNPAFVIFNGDLENNGFVTTEIDPMISALGNLTSKIFLVRGNHDNNQTNSASLWQSYFVTTNRPLPSGVTNYVGLNSSSTYLTYSFDYGNSRFIGVDVPGDADLITSAEITFIDGRLTNAESLGLTHAFIFLHGPIYCVESTHCSCSTKSDASCTPSSIISLINKHPIVSATFHGHEHVLGYTHMNSARLSGLTHEYEQFITSPSGGCTYNANLYGGTSAPTRMDYVYPDMSSCAQGFATIDVNGSSFTFSIYKVGTTLPVWTKTFTKSGLPTVPVNNSPTPTPTRTPTPNPTCQCLSGACSSSCVFDKLTSGVSYSNPIKCSLASDVTQSVPSSTQLNNWCKASLRTKGDANADGVVNMMDYYYYIASVTGGKIPASVNPDFDGDGKISTNDRLLLMKTLSP